MHDLDSRVHRLLKAWLAFILKVVQLSHNGVESITMEDISRTIRCGKKCGSNHSRQVMYYLPICQYSLRYKMRKCGSMMG